MIAGALLATLLLLQAVPMAAQGLVEYIEPEKFGTVGDNDYFTSDVLITWPVEPDWVPVGDVCDDTVIDWDTEGVDLACYGTTPEGQFHGEVTIKRDATDPLVGQVMPTYLASADEGEVVEITATGLDGGSGVASIEWDVNLDGVFETGNPCDLIIPDSKAGHVLPDFNVKVTDAAGNWTVEQVQVVVETIVNLPADVTGFWLAVDGVDLNSLGGLPLGVEVNLTAAFADPGVLDTHIASVDWGDGQVSPSFVVEQGGAGTASASHVYTSGGDFEIKGSITDDEGAWTDFVYGVKVLTVADSFGVLEAGTGEMVAEGLINLGQGNSLLVKVWKAEAEYGAGDLNVASNVLRAYQNELLDLVGLLGPVYPVAQGLREVFEGYLVY
jgi:hypothetical protein